jgi:UDP-glucose 6-dehydrogenase
VDIGIMGCGILGNATARSLEDSPSVRAIHMWDIKDKTKPIPQLSGCDYVFICVPSYLDDMGAVSWSLDIARAVADRVVIRSTLPVDFFGANCFDRRREKLAYMPEFLRERTWEIDAIRPDQIIVGAYNSNFGRDVLSLFSHLTVPYLLTTPETAAVIKLGINGFHLTRCVFANKLYDIAEQYGIKWDEVKLAIYQHGYIFPFGFDIDADGYRGAGGKCLPKDFDMLINASCNDELLIKIAEANNKYLGPAREKTQGKPLLLVQDKRTISKLSDSKEGCE